ncbi:MAG: hypothetical protein QG577_1222 [Thermodesulfobacteriota bacterium]|nr:hypothetical protein [Thermodesulfobacteriota bacterium]
MEYVHVESIGKPTPGTPDYLGATIGQVRTCLFSLIGGLKQTRSGMDTLIGVTHKIDDFRLRYLLPHEKRLLIDSGGYSIIVGDVAERDILKTTDLYHEYQAKARGAYDYIMTLDIPLILDNPGFNRVDQVYHHNLRSLATTRENMDRYPELREKAYLVVQFKTREHHEIWERISAELDLNRYFRHRALGGMVSLRKITGIEFSPFTPNAFKCLFDFLSGPDPSNEFRLHFLGINVRSDRFTIAILERLFRRYLGRHHKVSLTYDSIAHTLGIQRNMRSMEIYSWADSLVFYPGIPDVPDKVLQLVYPEELLEPLKEDIYNLRRRRRVNDARAFDALNVHSNVMLNRFFENVIDEYDLVDLIIDFKNGVHFANRVRHVFKDLAAKHPQLFTPSLVSSIETNLKIILDLSRWYLTRRDLETLKIKILQMIDQIGFPKILT